MSEQQPTSRRAEPILSELELYSEYRHCDRWAVIVGISRYRYKGWNLKYADRDAEELYNLLLTPSGGNFKKEFIRKLTNEEATTGNITQALRAFLKKPAREDLVIIYFACHGTPDFDRPANVYLLTHDTAPDDIAGTALPMREIDLSLRENLLADKVIVLADTCHSAAIGGGIGRRSAVDNSTFVNRYLQQVSQARGGIALLTSAEANEVSFENAKWGGGHGVFTHYLLEGMRGAADHDGNGIVTVGELFEYIRDNVKRETDYKQHPSIGTSAYDRNLPVAITSNTNSTINKENHKENVKHNLQEMKSKINIISVNFKLTHVMIFMLISLLGSGLIIYTNKEFFPPQKIIGNNPSQGDDNLSGQSSNGSRTTDRKLKSDVGIDYAPLQALLASGKWKAADETTKEVMLKVVKRENNGSLDDDSVKNFPCTDLRTIDQLWVKYSNGHFGLSVQKQKWLEVGGEVSSEAEKKLAKSVGWREGEQWLEPLGKINYSLNAPQGHLPFGVHSVTEIFVALFSRAESCKL